MLTLLINIVGRVSRCSENVFWSQARRSLEMAGLGQDQVRVIILEAGKNGRSLRYVRPFAGIHIVGSNQAP